MNEQAKAKLESFVAMKRENPTLSHEAVCRAIGVSTALVQDNRTYLKQQLGELYRKLPPGGAPRTKSKKMTFKYNPPVIVPITPKEDATKVMVVFCTPNQALELIHGQ